MYHFLYKITCVITQRYYLGMHSTSNINDGYFGSGLILRRSICKYGKHNHTRNILSYYNSRKELSEHESRLITDEVLLDPFCMNLKKGGTGGGLKGLQRSVSTKEKMKKARAKLKADGWKMPADAIERAKQKNRGRQASAETRQKMSLARKNKKLPTFSSEHRQKLSIARRKRIISEETKARISASLTNNPKNKGWQLSEESREKQKQASREALTNKPKEVVCCPHCNKKGGKPAMQRFHFQNCKHKKEN